MSVDTYLKGKNTAPYRRVEFEGLEILVAPALTRWAQRVEIGLSRFLFWKSFVVVVEHAHTPT